MVSMFLFHQQAAQAASASAEVVSSETTTTTLLADAGENLLEGDTVVPVLTRLLSVDRSKLLEIATHLTVAFHPGDFLFLALLGWGLVPLVRSVSPFKDWPWQLADLLSQVARLAMLVESFSCGLVVWTTLGFDVKNPDAVLSGFAKILYISWVTYRCVLLKRYLLSRALSKRTDKLGEMVMMNQLLDMVIYFVAGFFLLDVLDVEMGVGVSSLFAVGSVSTLVFGLATKDIAAMFVSGVALLTSDRIKVGDEVQFGDGTSGFVQNIGWMQTTIRNYDELIVVIPNSQLGQQRVTNISRCGRCQVKEFLHFRYEDAEKLPELLPAMLDEIKKVCPKAITDGSRPFRCVWKSYKENYLEIMVDLHFELPPVGPDYWKNREEVMKAIYRVVKKSRAEFVTTFYPAY